MKISKTKRTLESLILILLFTVTTLNIHGQLLKKFDYFKDLKTIDNLLKLTAIGNGYSDQTIVVFIPDATPGFDPAYDAYKLTGIYEAPQLYSIIPCCKLAVNALPAIETNLYVQFGFDVGAQTSYTISATELYTFDPSTTIHLFDIQDNVLVDLKTDSVYTFNASPDDYSLRFRVYFNLVSQLLNVKVNLEGPYNGPYMKTNLKAGGYIPISQPYNTSPWGYSGTESSEAFTGVVDWILVELRDATDAASATGGTMIERQAAFLLGSGNCVIEFSSSYSNNLYVVIWHRNHLPVLTANSVLIAGGVHSYDFTTGAGQAYNGTLAHKDLGGGVYGMVAGDADANGTINSDDKTTSWSNSAGKSGYLQSDLDLDGQTDNPDKNDVWLLNQGKSSQVPN
ncbi:MAG: hypothetical protein K8R86_07700 [Bacteroidales bacterium]|nr:hypothetical protein [Bacteroidales bacterium]